MGAGRRPAGRLTERPPVRGLSGPCAGDAPARPLCRNRAARGVAHNRALQTQDPGVMNRSRVLITGAAGRIGVALSRHLHGTHELRLADINTASLDPEFDDRVALDIRNFEACLLACEGMDSVVHLASDPSPSATFRDSVLPVGIEGTYNVFEAACRQGCKRIVFASSAQAIEGYHPDTQVQESWAPRPKNLYGVGKAFGEALASYYASERGLITVAVRIANLAEFQGGEVHSARGRRGLHQ